MSQRAGLSWCSNVAQVQFGTSLLITCIALSAYSLRSDPVLTWNPFASPHVVTRLRVNAGMSLTGIQFAFTSIESFGNEMVLPNAARSPDTLKRLFCTMKSNVTLLRRDSSPMFGLGGTDGSNPPLS